MKGRTKLIINHHNERYTDSISHTKEIVTLDNIPKDIAVSCDIMDYISLKDEFILVILNDLPGRIDYDKHFGTIHIFTREQAEYTHNPYSLLNREEDSVNLWELGERERVTLVEEAGELVF